MTDPVSDRHDHFFDKTRNLGSIELAAVAAGQVCCIERLGAFFFASVQGIVEGGKEKDHIFGRVDPARDVQVFITCVPKSVRRTALECNGISWAAIAGCLSQNLVSNFPADDSQTFVLTQVRVKTWPRHRFAKAFEEEALAFHTEEDDFFAVLGFDGEWK